MPTHWTRYRTALQSCINQDNSSSNTIYASVAKRNHRFVEATTHQNDDAAYARRRLINILDSSKACFRVEELTSMCSSSDQHHSDLVLALLEWMSSPNRAGISRVFIAVRILKYLGEVGVDINGHILEFLSQSRQAISLCKSNVYQLVSELVRSGHFSASRYLQWVISRGALSGFQALCPVSTGHPCVSTVSLLMKLPGRSLRRSPYS